MQHMVSPSQILSANCSLVVTDIWLNHHVKDTKAVTPKRNVLHKLSKLLAPVKQLGKTKVKWLSCPGKQLLVDNTFVRKQVVTVYNAPAIISRIIRIILLLLLLFYWE